MSQRILYRSSLRVFDPINRRIVIVSVLGLVILGFYFYVTSNNYSPKFSDIQPTSSSTCALDFISQVNCLPDQGQQNEQANRLFNKGIALEQLGHVRDAINYYDKALRLEPTNPDLIVRNGDALTKLKNYTGAIIYYEMALARYPNSSGSIGLMEGIADNLYHLGKHAEAIKYYDKVLVRAPNNVQAQQGKILALTALEKSTNKRDLAHVNRSIENN